MPRSAAYDLGFGLPFIFLEINGTCKDLYILDKKNQNEIDNSLV